MTFGQKDNILDRFCPRCGLGLTKSDLTCLRCFNKKPKRVTIKKYSGKSKTPYGEYENR